MSMFDNEETFKDIDLDDDKFLSSLPEGDYVLKLTGMEEKGIERSKKEKLLPESICYEFDIVSSPDGRMDGKATSTREFMWNAKKPRRFVENNLALWVALAPDQDHVDFAIRFATWGKKFALANGGPLNGCTAKLKIVPGDKYTNKEGVEKGPFNEFTWSPVAA